MKTLVTVLTEGFADSETALLNAAARGYFKLDTLFATPGGCPVTSAGGMKVSPDLAVADIDVDALDALVVCGGAIWMSGNAPEFSALFRQVHAQGKLLAVICDAVTALAKSGLIDDIAHTGNSAEQLASTGYAGGAYFRAEPRAVRDGLIITARGTAPASFMAETLRALGFGGPDLDFYLGLLGAEHRATA